MSDHTLVRAGRLVDVVAGEVLRAKVMTIRGMDVTIVTTARNDEEGRELLRMMRMPFRQR